MAANAACVDSCRCSSSTPDQCWTGLSPQGRKRVAVVSCPASKINGLLLSVGTRSWVLSGLCAFGGSSWSSDVTSTTPVPVSSCSGGCAAGRSSSSRSFTACLGSAWLMGLEIGKHWQYLLWHYAHSWRRLKTFSGQLIGRFAEPMPES